MNTLTILALVLLACSTVVNLLLLFLNRKLLTELARKQNPPPQIPANHVLNSPHPKELQEKFLRLGWGAWVPTPGVTDEHEQIYLTINGQHIHVMSVEEALALSDDELKQRMEDAVNARVETRISTKYKLKERVRCEVDNVTFTGTIAQCKVDDAGTVYHVEADIQGSTETYPLFVQEDEIIERIEE